MKGGSAHSRASTETGSSEAVASRTISMRSRRERARLIPAHHGSGGTPDPSNVIEHVEKSMWVERQNLRRTPDCCQGLSDMSRGNRADAAQILGKDQVGLQLFDELSIESIDRV